MSWFSYSTWNWWMSCWFRYMVCWDKCNCQRFDHITYFRFSYWFEFIVWSNDWNSYFFGCTYCWIYSLIDLTAPTKLKPTLTFNLIEQDCIHNDFLLHRICISCDDLASFKRTLKCQYLFIWYDLQSWWCLYVDWLVAWLLIEECCSMYFWNNSILLTNVGRI